MRTKKLPFAFSAAIQNMQYIIKQYQMQVNKKPCAHRDIELAKFEAFLNREQCKEIKALVRGRQQLAYPIKG